MPIIPIVVAALAWATAYAFVVASSFLITFAIASTVPGFVARKGRMSGAYMAVQAAVWLLCSAVGGCIIGSLAGDWHASLFAILLAFALIAVLWLNAGDTGRQDGLPYRLLTSVITLVGVMGGYILRVR